MPPECGKKDRHRSERRSIIANSLDSTRADPQDGPWVKTTTTAKVGKWDLIRKQFGGFKLLSVLQSIDSYLHSLVLLFLPKTPSIFPRQLQHGLFRLRQWHVVVREASHHHDPRQETAQDGSENCGWKEMRKEGMFRMSHAIESVLVHSSTLPR